MIKYKDVIDEKIILEQIVDPPTVSIDTWFWRLLSSDNTIKERFIQVGRDSNVTIMYSFVTLVELFRITDNKQIEIILEVMENLDYGFFYANPKKVINNELSFERSKSHELNSPIADIELIKQFHYSSNPLKPFNIADFFRYAFNQNKSDQYKKIYIDFGDSLIPLIEKIRNDNNILNKVKSRLKKKDLSKSSPPYTQDIYRYAIDFVEVNRYMNMPNKEWFDLFNTIVPVSYFTFVLLDKRWCTFINNYLPLKYPDIAKIYNKSLVDEFLKDIKNYKNNTQPNKAIKEN